MSLVHLRTDALVVVIDAGGNVLDDAPSTASTDWWNLRREQHSYYRASRKSGLQLIDRDFELPRQAGIGEIYRAFTYYLGWHSSTNSSKTMALAGHGRRNAIPARMFDLVDGRLESPVPNTPDNPIQMVADLAQALDVDFGEPRSPGGAILQIHKDVAAFLQSSVETALQEKLRYLRRAHPVTRLCVSGGFGLNVVANGQLIDMFPDGVYVPSAPGDDGQCLGNVYALATRHSEMGVTLPTMAKSSDVSLGPPRHVDSQRVVEALAKAGLKAYIVFESSDFTNLLAGMLAGGSAVCLYQSRSEFGPRALGFRSIVADPRRPDAVSRLNDLKKREWFMPFAPVVLEERMEKWFKKRVGSPFMSFAIEATDLALREIPAVVNRDGTARVQTVGAKDGGALRRILEHFARRTGVPVLLNTSYNLGNKPIVETVNQAIDAFSEMPVNALGIGRFVILKSLSPDLDDLPIASSMSDIDLAVYRKGSEKKVPRSTRHPWKAIRALQSLTDAVVFVRTELPLYDKYLTWLRQGRKVTTIRFRKGAVEVPFSSCLPLYETADFGPGDRSRPTERVQVSALRYRIFGELSAADAKRDGFDSRDHMRRALREIYPKLSDSDWVTVYDIRLLAHDQRTEAAAG